MHNEEKDMNKRTKNEGKQQTAEAARFAGTFGGPGAFMQKKSRRSTASSSVGAAGRDEVSHTTYRPSGTLC